jgi:hypothetical protein
MKARIVNELGGPEERTHREVPDPVVSEGQARATGELVLVPRADVGDMMRRRPRPWPRRWTCDDGSWLSC